MMEPQKALWSAATSTFETLAFVVAEEAASGAEPATWAGEARVRFRGPRVGELIIRMEAVPLATVASNMLGSPEAPTPTLRRDALGELANVICGHVLPLITGTHAVYSLTAPIIGPARVDPPGAAAFARVQLQLDNGRAEVTIRLAEPVAA